jgi:hypothetical protein
MDFVEPHEAENLANARYGLQQVQGVGIRLLRGLDDGEFQITEQLIIKGDQDQVDLDILLHRGIGKAFGDAPAVGFVGEVRADLRQVVLAMGILDVR